jgi:hypothetical protein
MENIALNKPIEESIRNASKATDGSVTGYSGSTGYAEFICPGTLTVNLEHSYDIYCIRFLLWDGLGKGEGQRDPRTYKYRLLTSEEHQTWEVLHDTAESGYNGWQVFNIPEGIRAQYIRIHGMWNSANLYFQIVQVEAYDAGAPPLNAECILEKTIILKDKTKEIGDALPIATMVRGIINNIDRLVEDNKKILNPEPFRECISQLRLQISDIDNIERSTDSIRRRIIEPVASELKKSFTTARGSLWAGIIGGILAAITLFLYLLEHIGWIKFQT